MHTVPILGIPFDAMTETQALTLLQAYLDEPRNHVITTPNPEAVMQARRNLEFKDALMGADLRLADGIGIVWASRIQAIKNKPDKIPMRVRGVDTCIALFKSLSALNRPTRLYLLGGAPGVAETARENIQRAYPSIQVVGLCDGYLNVQKEKKATAEINNLQPEILLVCMGMPRQEIWAHKHRSLPVRLTLCLGGTLDILAGSVILTPAWMRKLGLEWLHRLLRQPSRAKRMLDLPRFAAAVLINLFHRD